LFLVAPIFTEELLDDIKQACDEGPVDPGYIGFKHVKQDLAVGKVRLLARLAGIPIDALCRTPWPRWNGGGHAFGRIARTARRACPGFGKFQGESSCSRFSNQKGNAEDRQERAMSVRERQEMQKVLWRLSAADNAPSIPSRSGFDNARVNEIRLYGTRWITKPRAPRLSWTKPFRSMVFSVRERFVGLRTEPSVTLCIDHEYLAVDIQQHVVAGVRLPYKRRSRCSVVTVAGDN
jgi:hypothetical protein